MIPTTLAEAQGMIRTWEHRSQQAAGALDTLQAAVVAHIADTVPFAVKMLPNDLKDTCIGFDGFALIWSTNTENDGTYHVYTYEPFRGLAVDVAALPVDAFGETMPLLCWRNVLWVPVSDQERQAADAL